VGDQAAAGGLPVERNGINVIGSSGGVAYQARCSGRGVPRNRGARDQLRLVSLGFGVSFCRQATLAGWLASC
jgi:hypothetical protein